MEENKPENFPHPLVNQEIAPPLKPPPAPDNPPWNSGVAFALWLSSILFIAVLPTIAVFIYIALRGYNLGDSAQIMEAFQKDSNAILVNILAIIPAHICTLVLAWIVVTRAKKYSFREMLGWQRGGFTFWHLVLILITFFLFAALLTSVLGEQDNEFLKVLRSSRAAVFAVAFMATFTAPLVEEVVYRGVLYSAFQRTFGVPLAVILVTVLFALVHVPQYLPSVATILLILLLSLILTLIRVKTGNLLPCIILHTVFNGIQSVLLILEPYLRGYVNIAPEQGSLFIQLLR